ncbi:MAG: DUF1232 domain-containing protein [Tissierellia bacterium]|nr:DUF1232 domain-containing protein [Tissierellia bacterium]
MKINLKNLVKKYGSKAKILINNPLIANKNIQKAFAILSSKSGEFSLAGVSAVVITFLNLLNDSVHGLYKNISKKAVFLIAIGILYLVNPIDLIPDAIPILGFTDDIAVINLIFKNVEQELNNYTYWRSQLLGFLMKRFEDSKLHFSEFKSNILRENKNYKSHLKELENKINE